MTVPPKYQPFLFAGVVLVLLGLFYFPAIENRTEAEDAFAYAREVEELSYRQLLHPHHRLYHPIAKAFFSLSGAERSLGVLVWFSALMAGLGLWVFYLLVRQQTSCGPWQSLAWTSCLAFSYGFWRYAREVEVYAMGWLACLLAVAFLFCSKGKWRKGLIYAVVVVLVLNVHRALGPPLLVMGMVYFLRERQWRVAVGSLSMGLVLYGLSEAGFERLSLPRGSEVPRTELTQFFSESLQSLGEEKREGRSFKVSSLPKGTVGLGVSLFGGNVLMASDEVYNFLATKVFPYRFMEEEKMMAQGVPAFWILVWVVTILVVGASFLAAIFNRREIPKEANSRVWAIAVGFLSYAGMILVFEPGNPEMWLLGLPLLWLAVVFCLREVALKRLAVLAASVALASYLGGMGLLSDRDRDYHVVTSSLVRETGNPADLYLMGTQNAVHRRFVTYYVPVEVVVARTGDPRGPEFYRRIHQEVAAGRRVFVHETLFEFEPEFETLLEQAGLAFRSPGEGPARRQGGELFLRDDH